MHLALLHRSSCDHHLSWEGHPRSQTDFKVSVQEPVEHRRPTVRLAVRVGTGSWREPEAGYRTPERLPSRPAVRTESERAKTLTQLAHFESLCGRNRLLKEPLNMLRRLEPVSGSSAI